MSAACRMCLQRCSNDPYLRVSSGRNERRSNFKVRRGQFAKTVREPSFLSPNGWQSWVRSRWTRGKEENAHTSDARQTGVKSCTKHGVIFHPTLCRKLPVSSCVQAVLQQTCETQAVLRQTCEAQAAADM